MKHDRTVCVYAREREREREGAEHRLYALAVKPGTRDSWKTRDHHNLRCNVTIETPSWVEQKTGDDGRPKQEKNKNKRRRNQPRTHSKGFTFVPPIVSDVLIKKKYARVRT